MKPPAGADPAELGAAPARLNVRRVQLLGGGRGNGSGSSSGGDIPY